MDVDANANFRTGELKTLSGIQEWAVSQMLSENNLTTETQLK